MTEPKEVSMSGSIHSTGRTAAGFPLPSVRLDHANVAATNASIASHSRSPFRSNAFTTDKRRRSSSRQTATSSSSASRPLLTSRPVLLWTHEPPNFSTHELVLNPDLIAAFGGVSDGSELLEVRLPESSSQGNAVDPSPLGDGAADRGSSAQARARRRRGQGGVSRRSFVFKASQAVGDIDCIERCGTQLQLSVARNIANIFGLYNRCEIQLSKVSRLEHTISHIELYFRDQYVGRADMWRLVSMLEDTCVYVGQRVTLAGCVRATIGRIFIDERKVMSGFVGPQTRAIFRSESAKYNIFIQMASEMWDFDEDGELYYEKALSGFLPDLIRRWQAGNTTHVVSVILFARVHYTESEVQMLQESELPIRREERGRRRFYIDYYKVVVDLESDCEWQLALDTLKEEFFRFRHDILLLRRPVSGPAGAPWLEEQHADLVRRDRALMAGTLSSSHEGNVLETINLALNPFDEHYIDRDLNRTGLDIVVLTAGTGHFDVDKRLLRLTTERLIDNGIGLDLVCLTKMPLHSVPLFHFQSHIALPEAAMPRTANTGSWTSKRKSRNTGLNSKASMSTNRNSTAQAAQPPDPLYFDSRAQSRSYGSSDKALSPGNDPENIKPVALTDFYSIPHWVDCSFYNMQQDKPFRADRFVPRCKMHEVQMLGLMEDEISDIALPYLDFTRLPGISLGYRQGKVGSQAGTLPFSSSESFKFGSRPSQMAAESFGDTSGLGKRERKYLLRERFDKEQFRDLEDVPAAFRQYLVQGGPDKSLLAQPSPLQDRPGSRFDSRSNPNTRNSTIATSPLSNGTGKQMASDSQPTSFSPRKEQSITKSSSPLRGGEAAVDGGFERRHPTQYKGGQLELRNVAAMARLPSSSASVRSINTLAQGLRPLSHLGKATPTLSTVEVGSESASIASGKDGAATATSLVTKIADREKEDASRTESSAKLSEPKAKTSYSWLWSSLRRKGSGDGEGSLTGEKAEEQEGHTSRQASLRIQAVLKGQASRSSSPSRSTPSAETDRGNRGAQLPEPISIPTPHAENESDSVEGKASGQGVREGEKQLAEQGAFEQALEEQEAKSRYASEARVEKQTLVNPCNPRKSMQVTVKSQIMRWQHAFPRRLNQHVVKWRSMTTPACLPLTTVYLPSEADLKTQWQEYPYQMSVSADMQSFLVKRGPSTPPALAVLREMASQRLAQGYQFIVPIKAPSATYTAASAMPDDLRLREPWELFQPGSLASGNPIYLSITNQIHRIHYDRGSNCIHVKRFVRRIEYDTDPLSYSCCVWARNLPGYQTVEARFKYPDLGAYGWTHLDAVIAGHGDEETFSESTRYWRTRFVVVPSEGSPQTLRGPSGEKLSDEEVRLAGMDRLADLFARARWKPKVTNGKRPGTTRPTASKHTSAPLRFIPTSLDPAMSLKDEMFMKQVEAAHHEESREMEARRQRQRSAALADRNLADISKSDLVKAMYAVDGHALTISDRLWNKVLYRDTFSGADFVTWLCQEFVDVNTRDEATEWGQRMIREGLMQHVHDYHGFLDGHYFYRLSAKYLDEKRARDGIDRSTSGTRSASSGSLGRVKLAQGKDGTLRRGSRRLMMSRSMIIDVDPGRRSERAEVAHLHYDLAHNPANGFNFQIHWLGSTARFIEDVVQSWTRAVDRYGLRLIEAPINQIKDVSMHNPFQAPLLIAMALSPPSPDACSRFLPAHASATHVFEYALLRRFGFILDQEASHKYKDISKDVVIEYRSRPNRFDYSQFVHRSGIAFVQVLPSNGGFLWLDNRLFNSHLHSVERPSAAQGGLSGGAGIVSPQLSAGAGFEARHHHQRAGLNAGSGGHSLSVDRVRTEFVEFCADSNQLDKFYKDVMEQLQADATAVTRIDTAAGKESIEP